MSQSVNRVFLIGRIGRDPEIRYPTENNALTTFSLATDPPSPEGREAEPDWHTVVCREKLAEFAAQYLCKGRLVCVVGALRSRPWEDRGGRRRRSAAVSASEIVPLDRRPDLAAAETAHDDAAPDQP